MLRQALGLSIYIHQLEVPNVCQLRTTGRGICLRYMHEWSHDRQLPHGLGGNSHGFKRERLELERALALECG